MDCCGQKTTFSLGERRLVTLSVWLTTGEAFLVSEPKWDLVINTRAEATGECELNKTDKGYELTALVEPKQRGRYSLVYSFGVGPEVRKKIVPIEVI